MNRLSFALAFVLATPLFACSGTPASSSDPTQSSSASSAMTVRGTLARSMKSLDNARAIAVGADGHVFAAYLDRQGRFTLKLPVGHAYRVVFANTRADGSEGLLGHVMIRTSNGPQDLLGVRKGGQIDLGAVSPTKTGGVRVACNCSGDGSGDHGDDDGKKDDGNYEGDGKDDNGDDKGGGYKSSGGDDSDSDKEGGDYSCHESDGEEDDVCKDEEDSDDEYYAEKDPGDDCDAHDLDDDDGKESCKAKTSKSCTPSSGHDAGAGKGGGGSGGGHDAGNGGSGGYTIDAGGKASGGCKVSADCGTNAVCCGGACHSS